MTEAEILLALLVIVSPFVGSLLGVVIDRLPRGLSIVRPGSCCRSCKRRLGLRDLVPILSFLATCGRCRHCGATIPLWLLSSEIAAVWVAILAVYLGATPLASSMIALILWLLWTLAVTDLLFFRLPDPLTGLLFLSALAQALISGDVIAALTGAALGAGSFFALRLGYQALRGREGLGLGDVKLMAGLGALAGPLQLPLLVLTASLLALVAVAASKGEWRSSRAFPFGVALAIAGAVIWLGPMTNLV